MRILKSKTFKYFILLFFFLFLFVAYDTSFRGPDDGYFSYTASVVEDGDLNIINQFYRDGKYISKTYNLPDPHYHGGVLLWGPFYAYAKIIYSIADKFYITGLTAYGLDRLARCAMSFSTIAFGFFTMFFTYKLLRIFFPGNIVFWSISVIFLGTPFFYSILYKPGNANIPSCLFSVLSIWFCSYMVSMKKLHWFLYGLFFSICVTVKIDLWLQVLFIFPLFIAILFLKQINWKNGICFIFGFLPIFILRVINAYLKYGILRIEESRFLIFSNLRTHYFYNGLFSSYRGIFYTSPIFYICVLSFTFIVINTLRNFKIKNEEKKKQSLFFLILTSYSIIKLFIIGFDFPEEDFAARFLITEFPIFVFLYAQAIHGQRRALVYFIGIASIFFVFWNLLVISECMTGLDWVYIAGAPKISTRINVLKYTLKPLFYIKDLNLKLKLCLPLVLAVFTLTFYIKKRFAKPVYSSFWYKEMKGGLLGGFSFLTIYLCIGYAVITLLNVYNNQRNVEKLKADGFFEDATVMEASEYEEGDFFVPRLELMQYYALKGRLDMFNKIRRYKDKYFTKKDIFGVYSNEAFRAYHIPGVAYRKKDDYNKAIECFNASIQLDPNDIDAYMNLGEIYLAMREYNKAIDCFQKITQINPRFIHSYLMLGETYMRMDNYNEAIKSFEKSTQIQPSRAEAYSNLGDIYYSQGNYDKAIFNYEKSMRSDPTYTGPYLILGEYYKTKSDYEKGIEYLQKALQHYPSNPDIYYSLGNIYIRIGDKKNVLNQVIKLRKLKRDDLADELERFIRENIQNKN